MGTPTLVGTTSVDVSSAKVNMKVDRNLYRAKVAFTGTDKAVVDSITGAMRFITLKGVVKGTSAVLNAWENSVDFNWSSLAFPEVKTFTTVSGNSMNVLPDSVAYDRLPGYINYTIVLIQTIKSAAS